MDYKELVEKSLELEKRTEKLYVYGAGMTGRDIAMILVRNGVRINGFVETDCKSHRVVCGIPVVGLDEIINQNVGLVVGMNLDSTKEAIKILEDRNMSTSRYINGGAFYSADKTSAVLRDNPLVEITPIVGCAINCKYCPQDLFINSYYKENNNRKRMMDLNDFKRILDNTPDNCTIDFAGLSEPFLHPNCLEMIKMACEAKRTVLLFSTFVGATDKDIDEVIKLPIEAVTVHCPDRKQYAKIPDNKKYYENMKKILEAQKINGEPWVTGVIAQAEATDEMLELCKGKHEIKYGLHDRAGVYTDADDNVVSLAEPHRGEVECYLGGPKCNSHVVCPDGTLLLCNQDFKMEYVIGNLYEEKFDDIQNSTKMQYIFRAMRDSSCSDLICRRCVCSHAVK